MPAENLKPHLAMIGKAMKPLGDVRIGCARRADGRSWPTGLASARFGCERLTGSSRTIAASSPIISTAFDVDEARQGLRAGRAFPVRCSQRRRRGRQGARCRKPPVSTWPSRSRRQTGRGPTDAAPSIVTSPGAPGAVLLHHADVRSSAQLGEANVAILQPAVKASIAALKARPGRAIEKWAKEATNAADRRVEADAESFKARIAAIMKKTNPKALPAPQATAGSARRRRRRPKPSPRSGRGHDGPAADPPVVRDDHRSAAGRCHAWRAVALHEDGDAAGSRRAPGRGRRAPRKRRRHRSTPSRKARPRPIRKAEAEKPEAVVIARDKAGKPAVTVEKVAAKARNAAAAFGPRSRPSTATIPRRRRRASSAWQRR